MDVLQHELQNVPLPHHRLQGEGQLVPEDQQLAVQDQLHLVHGKLEELHLPVRSGEKGGEISGEKVRGVNLQAEVNVRERENLDDVDCADPLFEEHHTFLPQQLEIVDIGGFQEIHNILVNISTFEDSLIQHKH